MTKKFSLVLVLVAVSTTPAWSAGKNNPSGSLNRVASKPFGLKVQSGASVSTRAYGKPNWILAGNTVISDHRPTSAPTSPNFANLAANGPPPPAHAIGTPPGEPISSSGPGKPTGRPHHSTSSPNGGVTVTIRPNPQRVNNVIGGW